MVGWGRWWGNNTLGQHVWHGESGNTGVERGRTVWNVEAVSCVVAKSQNASFLVAPLLA